MKKIIGITLIILFCNSFAYGEDLKTEDQNFTVGLELDVSPYITGGYYGSIWYGYKRIRIRGVIAKVTVPDFFIEDGFTNNKLKAYAFVGDYFFKDNFKGFWIGSGIEYWDSKIEQDGKPGNANYNNWIFTIGSGYVWKFWKIFYLNPWVAYHMRISGDKEVVVGDKTFGSRVFTPEASIKLGWHF